MIHRQQIFSIRKYAIGTSSILLGLTFFISASATASASELKNDLANQDTDVSPQATIDGHISKERLNASQTETKTADTQALGAQAISPTEQAKPQIDKTANSTAKMVSQNDSDSATKARTQPKQITQSKSSQNEQVHTQATSLSAKNAQNTSSLHAPVHHSDVVQAQPTTPSEAPLSHSPKEMRRPQATAAPLSRQNQTATARKTNSSTHPQTTHIVSSLDTLQSQQMKVEVDQNFPAIKQYKLKNGKTIPGQVVDSSQIIVNGEIIKPTVS